MDASQQAQDLSSAMAKLGNSNLNYDERYVEL